MPYDMKDDIEQLTINILTVFKMKLKVTLKAHYVTIKLQNKCGQEVHICKCL